MLLIILKKYNQQKSDHITVVAFLSITRLNYLAIGETKFPKVPKPGT